MASGQQNKHKPIHVSIADKSPLMQTALRTLFNEDDRFEFVSISKNSDEFLAQVKQEDIDVAIIGWVIPPGDARFILDHLRTNPGAPRVVVYSGIESATVPAHAMAHGAAAYVSKNEQPEYLLNTVAEVARGRMVFPYLDVSQINASPISTLTKRELEILSSHQ